MSDTISISEAARAWGISRQRVLLLATDGRIPGAVRIETVPGEFRWRIPQNSRKPESVKPYGLTENRKSNSENPEK